MSAALHWAPDGAASVFFTSLADALAAVAAAHDLPADARRVSVATDVTAGRLYEAQLQTRGGAMFYLVER